MFERLFMISSHSDGTEKASLNDLPFYHFAPHRPPETIAYYCTQMKSGASPSPCNRTSQPSRDIRMKVLLVARPLLTLLRKSCVGANVVY